MDPRRAARGEVGATSNAPALVSRGKNFLIASQGGQAAMADLLQSAGGALFRNLDGALKGGPAARALAAVAEIGRAHV